MKPLLHSLSLIVFLILFFQCKVDIRQVPRPAESRQMTISILKEPLYIGKFEILIADRIDYAKAWKYSFQSILRNNRVFSDVKDLNEVESLDNKGYFLDVEIIPRYEESYNYWWTWPAIYPFTGEWPVQIRNGNYEIKIVYTLRKENQIILQSSVTEADSESIYIYGFYRTSPFEKMIELTNLKALDKCSKDILLKLQ